MANDARDQSAELLHGRRRVRPIRWIRRNHDRPGCERRKLCVGDAAQRLAGQQVACAGWCECVNALITCRCWPEQHEAVDERRGIKREPDRDRYSVGTADNRGRRRDRGGHRSRCFGPRLGRRVPIWRDHREARSRRPGAMPGCSQNAPAFISSPSPPWMRSTGDANTWPASHCTTELPACERIARSFDADARTRRSEACASLDARVRGLRGRSRQPSEQHRGVICRCARGAYTLASSRVDAARPPAPPGSGECGVLVSSPASHPRPSR